MPGNNTWYIELHVHTLPIKVINAIRKYKFQVFEAAACKSQTGAHLTNMAVDLVIGAIALLAILLLVAVTVCYYSAVKRFLDYDRDNSVPSDIEEVVSKKIFSPPKANFESHSYPNGGVQSLSYQNGGEDISKPTDGPVIPKAEGRRTSWQFAVIILLAKKETKSPQTFQFKPVSLSTDSSKPFVPTKSELNNYMAARPEQDLLKRVAEYCKMKTSQHAEKIVLSEFEDLLLAYSRENKEALGGIVLYTWSMPCTECTTQIIDTLAGRKLKVTLAYTLRCQRESEKVQESNRERLRGAGVTIEYVPYKSHPHKKTS